MPPAELGKNVSALRAVHKICLLLPLWWILRRIDLTKTFLATVDEAEHLCIGGKRKFRRLSNVGEHWQRTNRTSLVSIEH